MCTTYEQRFIEAFTLLCGGRKPAIKMVQDWLSHESEALQDFAVSNGPSWCQGIALIDAAHLMAENPEEGFGHLD